MRLDQPGGGPGLLRQAIAGEGLAELLALLHRVLDVRITFFDLDGVEDDRVDVKPISDYCRLRRADPDFAQRCAACDRQHLEAAKRQRRELVYRCHDGLVEGVIPVYDRAGGYLGAIMFGQLRPAGAPSPALRGEAARLRALLPASAAERLQDLAALLRRLTDHIVAHELVRRNARPWHEAAAAHIEANLASPPGVADLARVVGRSPSFITHRFAAVFGQPLTRYVNDRRLAAARARLRAGAGVAAVAAGLGYCDPFHFSKAYKARFGIPPSGERPPG